MQEAGWLFFFGMDITFINDYKYLSYDKQTNYSLLGNCIIYTYRM
jgi:hypothetical protein